MAASSNKQKTQMNGKVVIVTGANTGIGYYTALELAKQGICKYSFTIDLY